MAKKYKCSYCEKRLIRKDLITHIDKSHKELIPENYTAARLVYNQVNKVDHGKCRVCGKPTTWSEKSGRYEVLCGDPKCKEHMREEYKKNMLRVKGTYNILNDPEQQKKMLANRSISGQYKFQDGGILTYTGSYEKKCLEFMDIVMQIPSKDILSPGPTLEYEYNGEKHFYITDFYYIPYNLIIEVKDGGDNLNTKDSASMKASREKTIEKEHLITDRGEYNYIRLTNNNFAQLIEVFMIIKEKLLEGDDSKTYRINESQVVLEDYFMESSNQLYHISNRKGITNINPSIPNNFMTKNGYEENKTKRVCFAPSVDQCLMGLSRNCEGGEFYVYAPDGDYKTYTPSIKEVPDVKITGEVWIKEPVNVKCVGKIKVLDANKSPGKSYSYGNNQTAELYAFDYKWVKNINESLEDVSGIIFGKRKLFQDEYITLYHGTDLGNLKEIIPNSYNAGLKKAKSYNESCELSSSNTGIINPQWIIFAEYMCTKYKVNNSIKINIKFLHSKVSFDTMSNKYNDDANTNATIRNGNTIYVLDEDIYNNLYHDNYNNIVRYEIAWIILSKYYNANTDRTIEAICVYESGMLDEFEAYNTGKIKRAKKYKEYVDANGITAILHHLNNHKTIIESVLITESAKTSFDDIVAFNLMLNNYEYIVPNSGDIISEVSDDAFTDNFRLLSPTEFEKYKGGVCWDYVVYEAYYFNKHFSDIPYSVYFEVLDNKADCPTHTFLIFRYDNKYYWFESSWKPMCGIYGGFTTEKDAVDYAMSKLDLKTNYRSYICKYDPLNSKMFGMTCEQYMEYFSHKVKLYKHPTRIEIPTEVMKGTTPEHKSY